MSWALAGCWRWSQIPVCAGDSTVPFGIPTMTKQSAQGWLRGGSLQMDPTGVGKKRHLRFQVVEDKHACLCSNILA